MPALFGFIAFVSFVCIFVGLIKPTLFNRLSKKPMTRTRAFATFCFAFLGSTILAAAFSPTTSQTHDAAKISATNTNTDVKPPTVTSAKPTSVPKVAEGSAMPKPSILDQLWSAVDTSIKTRENIDVHYLPDADNTVILYHQIDTAWDENAIVRDAYADLVNFGKEAFKIDGISEVEVITSSTFTDQYGKSDYSDAVRISMKKTEFQKYDWTALRFDPIWRQMKTSSSIYYIHPAILPKLDTNKLYLQ